MLNKVFVPVFLNTVAYIKAHYTWITHLLFLFLILKVLETNFTNSNNTFLKSSVSLITNMLEDDFNRLSDGIDRNMLLLRNLKQKPLLQFDNNARSRFFNDVLVVKNTNGITIVDVNDLTNTINSVIPDYIECKIIQINESSNNNIEYQYTQALDYEALGIKLVFNYKDEYVWEKKRILYLQITLVVSSYLVFAFIRNKKQKSDIIFRPYTETDSESHYVFIENFKLGDYVKFISKSKNSNSKIEPLFIIDKSSTILETRGIIDFINKYFKNFNINLKFICKLKTLKLNCGKVAFYQIITSLMYNIAYILNKQNSSKYLDINISEEILPFLLRIEYSGFVLSEDMILKYTNDLFAKNGNMFILNFAQIKEVLEEYELDIKIKNIDNKNVVLIYPKNSDKNLSTSKNRITLGARKIL